MIYCVERIRDTHSLWRMALPGICWYMHIKDADMFSYACVCACKHRGFNKAERIQTCMFYVHMLLCLALLTVHHSAGRHSSICTTPRNTHADLEQTLNCETACSYRLRWLWTACERSADIPPSLYQASNICLHINCLRPTCYQAIITPRNSWLDFLR